MTRILVYAELSGAQPTDVSLQVMAKARAMADSRKTSVIAAAFGSGAAAAAKCLATHGANGVCVLEDARYDHYLPTPHASAFVTLAKQCGADTILFPASTLGSDLAATVACALDAACVLDCCGADVDGGKVVLRRLEYDGKVRTCFTSDLTSPVVAALKDGCCEVGAGDPARPLEIVTLQGNPSGIEGSLKIIAREIAKKTVDLKAARVIVTAGAGIGSKENYKLIEDLATALGAEVGATRPVVDAGWATHDRQIGQTGAVVRPDLYIACGVSGAVQHRVGMADAKKIIAINTDASAPIFKFANYRIVGDVATVIPKLLELLR